MPKHGIQHPRYGEFPCLPLCLKHALQFVMDGARQFHPSPFVSVPSPGVVSLSDGCRIPVTGLLEQRFHRCLRNQVLHLVSDEFLKFVFEGDALFLEKFLDLFEIDRLSPRV